MKFCRRENFNEQFYENVPNYNHDARTCLRGGVANALVRHAPLKLRPYGAIQMCILLLLLLCAVERDALSDRSSTRPGRVRLPKNYF